MNNIKFLLLASLIALSIAGCATKQEAALPMSYEQCSEANYCTLKGTMSVHWANHVKMGKLDMGDGKCIDVSLSAERITYFENNPNSQTIINGKNFNYFHDETIAWLEINGRRVGMTLCNSFYVFVE